MVKSLKAKARRDSTYLRKRDSKTVHHVEIGVCSMRPEAEATVVASQVPKEAGFTCEETRTSRTEEAELMD